MSAARRSRRGSNALEAALVFSFVLVPTMSGIIDYGLYFSQRHTVSAAIGEAGRLGALVDPANTDGDTPCNVAEPAIVASLIGGGIAATSADVDVDVDGATGAMDVTVRASFTPIFGLIPTPSGVLTRTLSFQIESGHADCGT